jgi:hypothetical protein
MGWRGKKGEKEVGRGGEKRAGRANWALEEFGPRGKKKKEMRDRRGGPCGMDREEERRGFDSFFLFFFFKSFLNNFSNPF